MKNLAISFLASLFAGQICVAASIQIPCHEGFVDTCVTYQDQYFHDQTECHSDSNFSCSEMNVKFEIWGTPGSHMADYCVSYRDSWSRDQKDCGMAFVDDAK